MGDDDGHDLGQFRPLLAIHDVLLFLGERHLVGRFRISLPGLAAGVTEPRSGRPVCIRDWPVGVLELARVGGHLSLLPSSRGFLLGGMREDVLRV